MRQRTSSHWWRHIVTGVRVWRRSPRVTGIRDLVDRVRENEVRKKSTVDGTDARTSNVPRGRTRGVRRALRERLEAIGRRFESTNAKANAKGRGRRHERARGGLIFVSHRHSSSRGRGETNSRVREATSAWRQSSDAAVVHDRETRCVRSRRRAIHSRIHRWCRTIVGRSFPSSDLRDGASSGTRRHVDVSARPPTATRVARERFHGDIIVSLSLRVRTRRVDGHGDSLNYRNNDKLEAQDFTNIQESHLGFASW